MTRASCGHACFAALLLVIAVGCGGGKDSQPSTQSPTTPTSPTTPVADVCASATGRPASETFGSSGGTGTLSVDAPATCVWSIGFVTPTTIEQGIPFGGVTVTNVTAARASCLNNSICYSGSGVISYQVSPNTTSSARGVCIQLDSVNTLGTAGFPGSPCRPLHVSQSSASGSGTAPRPGIWRGSSSANFTNVVCGGGINAQCNVVTFDVNVNNSVTCFVAFFGYGPGQCDADDLLGHRGTGTPIQSNSFTVTGPITGFRATGQFDSATQMHGTITIPPGSGQTSGTFTFTATHVGILASAEGGSFP
jgi:hypothetical protein